MHATQVGYFHLVKTNYIWFNLISSICVFFNIRAGVAWHSKGGSQVYDLLQLIWKFFHSSQIHEGDKSSDPGVQVNAPLEWGAQGLMSPVCLHRGSVLWFKHKRSHLTSTSFNTGFASRAKNGHSGLFFFFLNLNAGYRQCLLSYFVFLPEVWHLPVNKWANIGTFHVYFINAIETLLSFQVTSGI